MKKTLSLSLLVATMLTNAQAQNSITLAPLLITSTAIKTDELKSTDAVEVYTQEDIANSQARDLYEFFNTQTSLITMPSSGNPFLQKLDMRGFGIGDGHQNIVITINGRRLNNIDMVPQLLSSISPESVEKIEIIKSSGIVIGGDGANAGVINITTKKSNNKNITFYGGAYGAFGTSLYVGHIEDTIAVNGSLDVQKFDGTRRIDTDGSKDENKLARGTIELTHTPIESLEFRYGAMFSKMDVFYGGTMKYDEYQDKPSQQGTGAWGPSALSQQKFSTNAIVAGMSYFVNDKFSINLDANHENKKMENITFEMISDYTYSSGKIYLDYSDDLIKISTGIDIFDGERDSHANAFAIENETSKQNLAGFIMGQLNYENNSLKAGYRYEKVTYKFQDITTSIKDNHKLEGIEFGYNYQFNKEYSLFANYAYSYQAPDIDRFFLAGGTFNGFIQPMKANNYTLGFNSIYKNNKFKASAYYIDLKDEIYYYPGINRVGDKNTNIDSSYKYGFDLYNKYIISNEFNIMINYNYIQAIIDKETENGEKYDGNKLPGVSNHNAKATLNYLPTQRTTLALTQIYRSKAYAMNDFGNNFNQRQEAFKSTDISVKYTQDNIEFFAKVNNIFNQKNGMWIQDDAIYPINFTTTAIAGFTIKY